jgi:hypothetical protein
MDKLSFPWMFIGPPGSGKTTAARKMLADSMGVPIEDVYPKDTRIFKVGDDYDCRVYCSPYHFEIDIPDMSMQDKQILVEILSMLFSAGDVFAGLKTNKRKLVILRRAHCLSLAAAVRLRWILETRICPQDGTGMIWICAREITGALSVIEDIFVRVRIRSTTPDEWRQIWKDSPVIADSYDILEGRMDRATALKRWGDTCTEKLEFPRVITNCYEYLIAAIIRGSIRAAQNNVEIPPLALALWIRERVYDLLGLCQTGIEFLDGYSSAIETALLKGYSSFNMFKCAILVVATAEPNTSYRNPISLEKMLLDICIAYWKSVRAETSENLAALESKLPVEVHHGATSTGDLDASEAGVGKSTAAGASGGKKSAGKGVGKSKKRIPDEAGATVSETPTKTKSRTAAGTGKKRETVASKRAAAAAAAAIATGGTGTTNVITEPTLG